MRRFPTSAWSPIGLDISTHRVCAVQLDPLGRIRAFASFARREPQTELSDLEAARIREVLDRHGFRGGNAVVGAPAGTVRSTVLELPPASSGAPVEQLARHEISRIHKLQPNSFAIGMWELPPSSRASSAAQTMAITCENRLSDALCETLDGAGIEPIAIDLPALAATRALPIDAVSTQAILEFEESRSTLVVVHHGTIVFERVLSGLTMRTFRSQIAKAMRFPVAGVDCALRERGLADDPEQDVLTGCAAAVLEPFIEEIAHTAAYASSRFVGALIQKVFLIGSGSGVPGLTKHLSKSLECEFVAPVLAELGSPRGTVCDWAKPGQGVVALGMARWRSEAA